MKITTVKAQNSINDLKTKYSIYASVHIVPPWRMGISTAFQCNLNKIFFAEVYGSVANDFLSKQEKYLKRNYNLRSSAKTGIGIAFNSKKIKTSLSFLGGFKTDALSESINNPNLPFYEYKNSFSRIDAGFMHRIVWGKNKTNFFTGLYFPIIPNDIKYDYKTEVTLDFGINISLK